MKRKGLLLALAACLLLGRAALAQTVTMPAAYCSFDYPGSWLVLSPQRCTIYEPVLTRMGLDADAMAEEMEARGVLTRAIPESGGEALSVIIRTDAASEAIYDISEASDEQRRSLKSRALDDRLWERTGYRAQDAAWQIEGGRYWLFVHYAETDQGNVLSRGLRYFTIRNGMYLELDWNLTGRRFTNRDLAAFRNRLSDFAFLEIGTPPARHTALECELPTETNEAALRLAGTATPRSALLLTADDGKGNAETLCEEEAEADGRFVLEVMLPREGTWHLTLTAQAEGREAAVLDSDVAYSEKTLPVSGIRETMISTGDKFMVSGKTLSGASLQLVTPYGVTKKRTDKDGAFSFELTTRDVGSYSYTLLIDRKGYSQRRLPFTVVREQTDEQERQAIRDRAVRISYAELSRDLAKNRGSILNLYGYVEAVSEAGESRYVRLLYSRDKKNGWFNPVILVSDTATGAGPGDLLTCTAEVEGVDEEEDAHGETVHVPRLRLLFVDRIE